MSFLQRLFKFRIFKFRATLTEELEDLHTELHHLQETLVQTRIQQRIWTKWFAIYATLIYLVVFLTVYGFFLPEDYLKRTYTIAGLVAVGVLCYSLHWLLRWYFRTIIQMKEDRISLFNDRKQELIEEVKNKETYSKAKELLEKYEKKPSAEPRPTTTATATPTTGPPKEGELRQRVSIRPPAPSGPPTNIGRLETINRPPAPNPVPGKLPRAILPPQRTLWGTILDAIVGDGPSKRYALICRSCNSHNGMALEEEFEYLSFRCAYCNYYNSARKQKPVFSGDLTSPAPASVLSPPQPAPAAAPTASSDTPATEPMETSSSSPEVDEETADPPSSNTIHRSFPLPAEDSNQSHSRSSSTERPTEHSSENNVS